MLWLVQLVALVFIIATLVDLWAIGSSQKEGTNTAVVVELTVFYSAIVVYLVCLI